MGRIVRIAIALLASYGAGFVGYLFVDTQVSSWYAGLTKPPLTPADAVFMPVWLVLYALMAVALSIVWAKKSEDGASVWVRFYFVQLALNVGWTMFFFGFHAILIAFIDILLLGFILICLVAGAWEIDRRATYLLLPYLAWVIFAGYLTLGIWILN